MRWNTFRILAAVTINSTMFRDMTLCSQIVVHRLSEERTASTFRVERKVKEIKQEDMRTNIKISYFSALKTNKYCVIFLYIVI
jgi:hypothetical protein